MNSNVSNIFVYNLTVSIICIIYIYIYIYKIVIQNKLQNNDL